MLIWHMASWTQRACRPALPIATRLPSACLWRQNPPFAVQRQPAETLEPPRVAGMAASRGWADLSVELHERIFALCTFTDRCKYIST